MHGEIKLKRWLPFTADEVLRTDGDMLWRATVWQGILPIRGADRFVAGHGSMQWKLAGLIPVMTAAGPDISRSTVGRVIAESVWLPSAFLTDGVTWTGGEASPLVAHRQLAGEPTDLALTIDDEGRVTRAALQRWANPDERGFRYVDFGAIASAERAFDGYTIPTQLRVGYYPGTARFDTDGEFFRVTVDDAEYA